MKKILLTASLLVSCIVIRSQSLFDTSHQNWADSVFSKLNTDEKIGQLLMPRGNYNAKYDPELIKYWLKEYKIGGFVFFAGSPTNQANLVNELQSLSKVPLLIGMDLEWGLAMRLDSTVRFPYSMTLGAIQGNNDLIEKMGYEIGLQCKRMGVHINYAPVVDVNNNPNNPVINFRSFGENKYKVAEKGLAYMKGLQAAGIITSAKHFPGHGDTGTDSHYDLPLISHSKARLDSIELYPYKQLIANGLQGAMIAHLNIPSLDATPNQASTLSKKIVSDLLRKELNFKGLVFTDAMDMKAATKYFPEGKANVKAILAGNDVLETLTDIPGAFNAIKYALLNKEITQAEIDERVKKILLAKAHAGLWNYKQIETKNLVQDLNTQNSDALNRELAEKAIVVLKNEAEILPIKDLANTKIASLSLGANAPTIFQKTLDLYTKVKHFNIDENTDVNVIKAIKDSLKSFDLTLLSLHGLNIRPANNYSLKPRIQELFEEFANSDKAITALFSNVYTLGKFNNLKKGKALIMGMQETNYTQMAAAELIFGAKSASGKLPATVNEGYRYYDGIETKKLDRFSYVNPLNLGIQLKLNLKIDSIVNEAIAQKATPGAVVLLAKDGKVFFHKAYGKHTYEGTKKVELSDLYDLASITKISTSVLAFMKLQDEGNFSLNKTLGEMVPLFANSNKADLNYKDILAHQSRLKAWIPFWMNCIDSLSMIKSSPAFQEKYKQKYKLTFFQKIFSAKKTNAKNDKAILNDTKIWTDCVDLKNTPTIWKPNTYSNQKAIGFENQVAENLWIHSSMPDYLFKAIETSPLREKKEYVYSDLSYYLAPQIVKNNTGQNIEPWLKNNFYKPLGANSLTYNAYSQTTMDKIVPTEYDSLYRKSLIHGRVHDEGASILDGISGHAGLFGNANDLAKLMQMYLNRGSFGGVKYLNESTINEWTSYPFDLETNSRRGVGFDKPDRKKPGISTAASASAESFGHSGFTGTYTWVDPKYNLVYVFLSNRVYPTRNNSKLSDLNVRTNILEEVYKELKSLK
jgi:beta-glucosidase-like glycosyl hydrolase/CubicO group peptidase (beta-lactamase class C family)